MSKTLLFDRIIDGVPIPNGLHSNRIIDLLLSNQHYQDYCVLTAFPKSLSRVGLENANIRFALSDSGESGVYPVCIQEPSFFSHIDLNALLLHCDETLLARFKNGYIALTLFIEEEPTKDFNSIISLCDTLYTWGIERFRIFSHLSASISAQSEFAQHFFYSAHFEIEAKF